MNTPGMGQHHGAVHLCTDRAHAVFNALSQAVHAHPPQITHEQHNELVRLLELGHTEQAAARLDEMLRGQG